LIEGEEVVIKDIAPEEECMREMLVETVWSGRTLAVPLSQIEPVGADEETGEAVDDWHYWVKRGYEF